MDFNREYAEAIMPDQWQVLGLRLKPFTVGHRLVLHRIGSPFVADDATSIEASDLIDAAWICSRSFAENVATIHHRPGLLWKAWCAWMTIKLGRREVFQSEADKFIGYIEAAHKGPAKVWTDTGAGSTGAPITMILVRDLMHHFGYTFEQVMDMPVNRALIERCGILETDGVVQWPGTWERRKANG